MIKRFQALFLAATLAVGLAGCSMGEEDQTYPLPPAPIAVALATQPPSSPATCPSTELAAVRVEWDATHRSLSLAGQKAIFPAGFAARELVSGRLEVLAPNGTVVARDGDMLRLGGPDYMHVCRVQGVEY